MRARGHYCRGMPSVRGFSVACALALLTLIALAPAAAAAGSALDVYADYADNRAIDGDYSFSQLKAALAAANEDELYGGFADAVSDALDDSYLGGSSAAGDRATASSSPLPEPRSPDESGDPPWPFLALSVLAAALVVTGAGSSIYRRARR